MSLPVTPFSRLVSECLRDPKRVRFTFLDEMGVKQFLDGETLVQRSLSLGAGLTRYTKVGDRVLLPFPSGLDFLVGFLGCVAVGRIPVPANYPKPHRPLSRFNAVANACEATLAITMDHILQTQDLTDKASMPWIAVEQIESEGRGQLALEHATVVAPDDVLFLQYTSGSTSTPKGVVVKSQNLFANLRTISHGFGLDLIPPEDRIVSSWLPAYHDMGLVGVLMSTLVNDGHAVIMSPATFLRRPLVWLRSIEQYRASITVSPTFGYQWAASRVSASEASKLNLRSLSVAACGAEPIQAAVLEGFSTHFATSGFSREAFYPCYGLAEATLMVSGEHRAATQRTADPSLPRSEKTPYQLSQRFDRHLLTQNVASPTTDDKLSVEIVNCGRPGLDVEVAIASSETGMPLEEGLVGKIVVRSPGVASGYWGHQKEGVNEFQFQFPDNDSVYLQTGDLGFIWNKDLYVTGRQKDLIIVAGQNYYPHDIEHTVAQSHPALSGCADAAFSIPGEATEQLVVVQELPRGIESELHESILRQIRLAVASIHDIAPAAVVLLRAASIPRTSSGKIQRSRSREEFLSGTLNPVARWQLNQSVDRSIFKDVMHLRSKAKSDRLKQRIMKCLSLWVAANTGEDLDRIEGGESFAELGIDSLKAVQMAQEIELWLKVSVSPVVAWSYPTCDALAAHLAKLYVDDVEKDVDMSAEAQDDLIGLLDDIEAMDEQVVDQICSSRRQIN